MIILPKNKNTLWTCLISTILGIEKRKRVVRFAKLLFTILISTLVTVPVLAEGFDTIQPANPLSAEPLPVNTVAISVKKQL